MGKGQLFEHEQELSILKSIERRVLWLSTYLVHYANAIRPNPDKTKVGGHQASSASVVSLMTAMYFKILKPGDRLAIKPHASPVFHAIQALRGRLPMEALKRFRAFGGLQAYPSRTKDPDPVDFSTGSVGLGPVAAMFGGLTDRYIRDHFGPGGGRYIALVGDAELDEGNMWEAIGEDYAAGLNNVLWVVDLNRQSLDRVVPDGRAHRIREMFRINRWHVINLKYGSRLDEAFARPGGPLLRQRIDDMSNAEYQTLLQLDGGRIRDRLVAGAPAKDRDALAALLAGYDDASVRRLLTDLGGHDLLKIIEAFQEAKGVTDRPTVIVAYTIKGWRLPFEGDPLNHSMLLTPEDIAKLQKALGIPEGEEWSGFPPESPEGRYIRAREAALEAATRPHPSPMIPPIPQELGLRFPKVTSTQEALGLILTHLADHPELAKRVVTVSPDVAVSTNLGGWINKKGVYSPVEQLDYFAEYQLPRLLKWQQTPSGQHLELGISENNLFLLLTALGLSPDLTGEPVFPLGTIYDCFIPRGLDAFSYGAYSGARFILVGTPSGISLSPEGGAHQSLYTPAIGLQMPRVVYFEPTFAKELEWILMASLAYLADQKTGQAVYLRLSTTPLDQGLFNEVVERVGEAELRRQVLNGAYRIRDRRPLKGYRPGENVVNIFATGVMVQEAVEASDQLLQEGLYANVMAVSSPDLLYRGYSQLNRMKLKRPEVRGGCYLNRLMAGPEAKVPIVTVMDGHSHTLSFIGAALAVPTVTLGVDDFGQSGSRAELYRHYEIGKEAIQRAARYALSLGNPGQATAP